MTTEELASRSVYRDMHDGERETVREAIAFYLDFWVEHLDQVPNDPEYEFVERHIRTAMQIIAVIESE